MSAARTKLPAGSIFLTVIALLGAACGSSAPTLPVAPQSAPATPAATVVGGFRADVQAMLQARDTIHPDGWFGMDRAEWIAAADEVAARAETLSDDQRLVELVRLAAMPTWNGRDGHSGIWPFAPDDGTHWRWGSRMPAPMSWRPRDGRRSSKTSRRRSRPKAVARCGWRRMCSTGARWARRATRF